MSALTATPQLTRLALRRDRIIIPVWVLAVAALALGTASSFAQLYPTVASRLPFARDVAANSGLVALTGQPFDLTSIGGLTAWRVAGLGALMTSIMSLLLVTRHTRAEEESNRLELVAAGAVGRRSPLTAGLLAALVADVAVAIVVTAGLIAQGLPAVGSLALGLAFAACGLVFASIAAVAAQLTESARAANGIASGLVGAAYLARAIGDGSGAHWVAWLSPIGWAQQVRAYAHERWWVLLLSMATSAALLAVAYRLSGPRDLGAGLLPARSGRPTGTRWLTSPTALAWRLQRGSLIGWTAGLLAVGLAGGAVAQSVASLVDSSPQLGDVLREWGGRQGVVDAYLASILGFGGIAAGAFAVQSVLRLSGEESGQRAEPLLATGVGRARWALSHLGVALAGPAVLMLAAGFGAGLLHGLRTGDVGGQLPRLIEAALVQVPAAWVFAGLALALFGLVPDWVALSWAAVAGAAFLLLLGPVLKFNHWIQDLSPFSHLPLLPGAPMSWPPIGWLMLITAALGGVGLVALRHRDIH
jgi:ABC-2 type transport system permease protein